MSALPTDPLVPHPPEPKLTNHQSSSILPPSTLTNYTLLASYSLLTSFNSFPTVARAFFLPSTPSNTTLLAKDLGGEIGFQDFPARFAMRKTRPNHGEDLEKKWKASLMVLIGQYSVLTFDLLMFTSPGPLFRGGRRDGS